MRLRILGCGGSTGVPLLSGEPGGYWGDCDPAEPRNRRTRASVLVSEGDARVLIDTSPDLREQLLAAGDARLTGVVYTHGHADHLHGIDELRSVNHVVNGPLPVYADATTMAEIERRFGYVFAPMNNPRIWYKPKLIPHVIDGPFQLGGITFQPFRQDHGYGNHSLGFRFGDMAYSTDCKALDEAAFAVLAGVRVWVVDCVRVEEHPTHSHLAQTLEWITRLKPERAILTHMNQTLDYARLKATLPPGVEPGFDGLEVVV
ncbi:MAG: MBL fold metallo-hydrolase [Thalassobaculales bacterium]